MEQVIIAMLGVIITLMLYLDRVHRADLAKHREETQRGFEETGRQFEAHREETGRQFEAHREETGRQFEAHREETKAGFDRVNGRIDKLTEIIIDLVRRVGRLEGLFTSQSETAEAR